jgi:hypothetical protein
MNGKKNKEIIKYRTNLNKNKINYSIIIYVFYEKLNIIIKYSNSNSDEIYEFANLYSFKQLQIINNYFKKFINLEQICRELDKLLKQNQSKIEEKNGKLILTIIVLINNETNSLSFNLLQSNANDFLSYKNNQYKNNQTEHKKGKKNISLSVAKNPKEKKYYNSPDYKEKMSAIEEMSQNNISRRATDDNINAYDKLSININRLMERISKLEHMSDDDDEKIMTIEDQLSKYEKSHLEDDHKYEIQSNKSSDNEEKNKIKVPSVNIKCMNMNDSPNQSFKRKSNDYNDNINFKQTNSIKNSSRKTYSKASSVEMNKALYKRKRKYIYFFKEIENYDQEEKIYLLQLKNSKLKEKTKTRSKKKEPKENIEKKPEDKEENENKDKDETRISDEIEFSVQSVASKNSKTGLPMVKRENLKPYINSRIFFTKKELKMVKKRIVKGNKNLQLYLDLLYRASMDGDFEDSIISFSEGVYPQLVLFYTEDGARFGAYVEKEKTVSMFGRVSYKEVPGTSFLLSLNSLKIYDINKGEIATDNREERLCFGRSFLFNENGSNWFLYHPRNQFLDIKCMIGDKKSNFGEIDTDEIVGTKKDYYLKDVEIFKVTVEKEEHDDKKDKFKEKEVKSKGNVRHSNRPSSSMKMRKVRLEDEDRDEDE